jgi:hypothetical protein
VRLLNGIFATPDIYAAIYLTLDIWEQNFESFHAFARSPSVYGGFEAPFLRHMMAERACVDSVWYEKARAKPLEHLPRFAKFVSTPRVRGADIMPAGVCAKLKERAVALLAEAERLHLKWNGKSYTRSRFLLGVLCSEKRRAWFASDLLVRMGHEDKLRAALAAASGGDAAIPLPVDPVDLMLQGHLAARWADGSMPAELKLWKIDTERGVIGELLYLATAPPSTAKPALSFEKTKKLYIIFVYALFVGFAHNLLLESYA